MTGCYNGHEAATTNFPKPAYSERLMGTLQSGGLAVGLGGTAGPLGDYFKQTTTAKLEEKGATL